MPAILGTADLRDPEESDGFLFDHENWERSGLAF
jgi:hypothetical protein